MKVKTVIKGLRVALGWDAKVNEKRGCRIWEIQSVILSTRT